MSNKKIERVIISVTLDIKCDESVTREEVIDSISELDYEFRYLSDSNRAKFFVEDTEINGTIEE
jgi:hypothetical protein